LSSHVAALSGPGPLLAAVTPTLASMLVGVAAGAAVLAVISGGKRLLPGKPGGPG
jgi:predicted DNA repair protein MutK